MFTALGFGHRLLAYLHNVLQLSIFRPCALPLLSPRPHLSARGNTDPPVQDNDAHHHTPTSAAFPILSRLRRQTLLRMYYRRLKDEVTIHTERVEGYSKSLKDDAQREVLEREEEAERARLEEEAKKAQEVKEAKEREDIER